MLILVLTSFFFNVRIDPFIKGTFLHIGFFLLGSPFYINKPVSWLIPALSGTTRHLLDENDRVFSQIAANLATFKVTGSRLVFTWLRFLHCI